LLIKIVQSHYHSELINKNNNEFHDCDEFFKIIIISNSLSSERLKTRNEAEIIRSDEKTNIFEFGKEKEIF
jgi:hypothetical protein